MLVADAKNLITRNLQNQAESKKQSTGAKG
jgi:hypothetical protein